MFWVRFSCGLDRILLGFSGGLERFSFRCSWSLDKVCSRSTQGSVRFFDRDQSGLE